MCERLGASVNFDYWLLSPLLDEHAWLKSWRTNNRRSAEEKPPTHKKEKYYELARGKGSPSKSGKYQNRRRRGERSPLGRGRRVLPGRSRRR